LVVLLLWLRGNSNRAQPSYNRAYTSDAALEAASILRSRLADTWYDAKYDLTRVPDVESSVVNYDPEFISSVRIVVDGPSAVTVYFRDNGRIYRFALEDIPTGRTKWLEPLEGLDFPAHLPAQR
jgi:hypothetical protein